nr:hypothetical protein [Tanacetum cinerariifolium]
MVKTSSSSENEACCSKSCKKNTDSLNRLAQVESRLVEHKDREIKYYEKIRGLEFKTKSSDDYIEILKKELETFKKEKEGLDGKLAGFQTASKDLDRLFESQRLDKNKEGLGYSVVPPAQIYSSLKKDMSWTGLLEFKDDTVIDYSRYAPTVKSSPDDAQNRNPSVTETEASISTILPKSFIKFVKANDSLTKSKIDKAEKAKKSPVKKRVKKGTSRSQNNTHKSFTPRPVVHKPYRPSMRPVRAVPRTILMTKDIGTEDARLLAKELSKPGRIEAIDANEDITLVNVQDDAEMFDVNDLGGEEVFVAEQEFISTVATITTKELTLAQALEALKTSKPKVKGIRKDRLDEEAAKRLQDEFEEEERLARESSKEQEANITLIET